MRANLRTMHRGPHARHARRQRGRGACRVGTGPGAVSRPCRVNTVVRPRDVFAHDLFPA